MKMKNPVVTKHGTEVVEKELWMVSYDVSGLHKPVKMIYDVSRGAYTSRDNRKHFVPEIDGADPEHSNIRMFVEKDDAVSYFNDLNRYRAFIVSNILNG